MDQNENKAGIYIHVPFCKQACHYCNFHFSTSLQLKEEFISSLLIEISSRKNYLENDTVQSIYFGGGTPSLLTGAEISCILKKINENYRVEANAEITLEANPDDLSLEKLKELKNTGINRLSIGIQSFFDADLLMMNRAHNSAEAEKCLQYSIDADFDNITADLIYGIPGQDNSAWEANIYKLLSYQIDHISCYALTVEPKTAMQQMIKTKKMAAPTELQAAEQFDILVDILTANGFEHYEISNFARNKKYARHNSSYWFGNKYLGAGPSAHSFNGISRQWNISNNSLYIKGIKKAEKIYEEEILTESQKINEIIMTSLRTMWGLDVNKFILEFGKEQFERLKKEGKTYFDNGALLEINDHIIISKQAKFISDKIISDLFVID